MTNHSHCYECGKPYSGDNGQSSCRCHEAPARADIGAGRDSIQIESPSDTESVPLSQTLAQAKVWHDEAFKYKHAHDHPASFRSMAQAYFTLLNRMSAQKAVIDTEQSGHVPSQESKGI